MADATKLHPFLIRLTDYLSKNKWSYIFFVLAVVTALVITISFENLKDDKLEEFKKFLAASGAVSLGFVMLLPDLARLVLPASNGNWKDVSDEFFFNAPMIVLKAVYIIFLTHGVSNLGDFNLEDELNSLSKKIDDKDDGAKEQLINVRKLRKKYDTTQMAMLTALIVMPIAMILSQIFSSRYRRRAMEKQKRKYDENLFRLQIQVSSNEDGTGYKIEAPASKNERETYDCKDANCSGLQGVVVGDDPRGKYYDSGVTRAKAHELMMEMVQKKAREQRKEAAEEVAGEKERVDRKEQAEREKRQAERDVELAKTSSDVLETKKEASKQRRTAEKIEADTAMKLARIDEEEKEQRERMEREKEQKKEEKKKEVEEKLQKCQRLDDNNDFIQCMNEGGFLTYKNEKRDVKKFQKLSPKDQQKSREGWLQKTRTSYDIDDTLRKKVEKTIREKNTPGAEASASPKKGVQSAPPNVSTTKSADSATSNESSPATKTDPADKMATAGEEQRQCVAKHQKDEWGNLFDCLIGKTGTKLQDDKIKDLKNELKKTDPESIRTFLKNEVSKGQFNDGVFTLDNFRTNVENNKLPSQLISR